MISHKYLDSQKATHPPSGSIGHIVAVFQIVAALAGDQGFAEAAGFQGRQVVFGAVNLVRLIQFFGTGGMITKIHAAEISNRSGNPNVYY